MLLELQWIYSGCMNQSVLGTVSHKHTGRRGECFCLLTLTHFHTPPSAEPHAETAGVQREVSLDLFVMMLELR